MEETASDAAFEEELRNFELRLSQVPTATRSAADLLFQFHTQSQQTETSKDSAI